MGKGDRKSKKGKIWSGSNGKARPTTKNANKAKRDAEVKVVKEVKEAAKETA